MYTCLLFWLWFRITTTAACMMDLRRYPLDEQNCTLEIESCKSKLHILCLVIKKEVDSCTFSSLEIYEQHCDPHKKHFLPASAGVGRNCTDCWIAFHLLRRRMSLRLFASPSPVRAAQKDLTRQKLPPQSALLIHPPSSVSMTYLVILAKTVDSYGFHACCRRLSARSDTHPRQDLHLVQSALTSSRGDSYDCKLTVAISALWNIWWI